jgi:predicted  nucleic acid-binding Zn-ribbon protein
MKNISRLLIVLTLFLFNSCDQSNSQLFDLILEIKSQNDQLLNEVKTLQIKSDLLISELRASAAKQEELLAKVNDLQSQLSLVLTQIGLLNDKLKNQDSDLQLVKNQLADLQVKYKGIFDQLVDLQKLSQILGEIEKIKDQFKIMDKNFTLLSGSVGQNKVLLDALKTQITSVQGQLTENLSKVSQLTSKLDDQDADISSIITELDAIKIVVGELKVDLSGLIKRLTLKVGDEFEGGIVFYIDATSLHGLIVTKTNLRDSGTEWGCYTQNIQNTSPAIGTGLNNTKEMLTQCVSAQSIGNWSAKIADQYTTGNFSDWYLPSKDELNLIYQNLHLKGIGNFSKTVPYWSSTQSSNNAGWAQNFGTGAQIQEIKSGYGGTGAVRAVRSF